MDKTTLFRQEVINHIKNKHYGAVCMNTPLPYSIISIGLSGLMIGLIAFMLVAEFSDTYTVRGYLNSSKGIAHVYPTHEGIITKCLAVQGKHVNQGDVLGVIHTTYESLAKHHTPAVFKQLHNRKANIEHDISMKQAHLNALKPLLINKYIPSNVYQATYDEISALEHHLYEINMALIKYNQSRVDVIRAPVAGIIANTMFQTGQYASPSKPLFNILPDNAHLIAQLFVPVSKSGFINQHDAIVIHYDAYPYQQFGIATGRVQRISQAILTDSDETKPIQIGEPYYQVTAHLDDQTIMLYGRQRPLQQGMTCSAMIHGARKKVWQWIVDPTYHYFGKYNT